MTESVRSKGSAHYKELRPEPIDVIRGWNLGFELGSVVKYVARHAQKGTPVEDLEKAKHFIELELEKYDTPGAEAIRVEDADAALEAEERQAFAAFYYLDKFKGHKVYREITFPTVSVSGHLVIGNEIQKEDTLHAEPRIKTYRPNGMHSVCYFDGGETHWLRDGLALVQVLNANS